MTSHTFRGFLKNSDYRMDPGYHDSCSKKGLRADAELALHGLTTASATAATVRVDGPSAVNVADAVTRHVLRCLLIRLHVRNQRYRQGAPIDAGHDGMLTVTLKLARTVTDAATQFLERFETRIPRAYDTFMPNFRRYEALIERFSAYMPPKWNRRVDTPDDVRAAYRERRDDITRPSLYYNMTDLERHDQAARIEALHANKASGQ